MYKKKLKLPTLFKFHIHNKIFASQWNTYTLHYYYYFIVPSIYQLVGLHRSAVRSHHVLRVRESDSHPACGIPLDRDVKVLVVTSVGVDAHKNSTLSWVTARGVPHSQAEIGWSTILWRKANSLKQMLPKWNSLNANVPTYM